MAHLKTTFTLSICQEFRSVNLRRTSGQQDVVDLSMTKKWPLNEWAYLITGADMPFHATMNSY